VAVLSVVFLQWLLIYQRHQEHDDHVMTLKPSPSPDDMCADERPPSPVILIPSITITNASPMPGDDDDNDNNNKVGKQLNIEHVFNWFPVASRWPNKRSAGQTLAVRALL